MVEPARHRSPVTEDAVIKLAEAIGLELLPWQVGVLKAQFDVWQATVIDDELLDGELFGGGGLMVDVTIHHPRELAREHQDQSISSWEPSARERKALVVFTPPGGGDPHDLESRGRHPGRWPRG